MKILLRLRSQQEGGHRYKIMLDSGGWDYSASKEHERKRNLEKLYHRTSEQIREEELLFGELLRREAHGTQWIESRRNVLKTFNKQSLQMVLERIAAQGGLLEPLPKKKKKPRELEGNSLAFPIGASTIFSGNSLAAGSNNVSNLRITPIQPLISSYVEEGSPPKRYKNTSPVMLRSTATTPIKQPNLGKIIEFMQTELQLPLPPLMTTGNTMPVFDELRCNVYMLLELRKQLAKAESEVANIRSRIMARDGAISPISVSFIIFVFWKKKTNSIFLA